MKSSFSLIEVIIATVLLSVVILSLYQVKNNNIFILQKGIENKKNKEYLQLVYDTQSYSKRDKNIYLDKFYNIKDDELRREFKEIKIKIKDKILESTQAQTKSFKLNIKNYTTLYTIENKTSKDIYRFELEF
ncbi:type IV pilus modification PilV family protein [Halarcobacter bivalviorum]|uniref:Prepilin-type N-terminal cleavage/methylation domain-containing protein n=1 Tax=Halarcobacter bivalviorum TaxID=663364 RepID=A0AAX2AAF4_9BACT|nr:prepilin-type N-terminal cleavage/methylation domain-containing protein [Halarcobacter bivalviorum]AXH12177.1 hypothetical protein ABIV_1174 [Halarcobacter bivalviorum]RXK11282.1 hypothetical protein CRV05_02635 [Halarcobacter bivalviorum]